MKHTVSMLAYDINVHDTCSVKGVEHHPGKNNFVSWERNHLCWSVKIVLYFTTPRLEENYEMGRGAICLLSSVWKQTESELDYDSWHTLAIL